MKIIKLFVTLLLFTGSFLGAQSFELENSQIARKYAEEKAPYSWQSLASMALWASGAEPDAYLPKLATGIAKLQAAEDLPADAALRGEYVLGFMHNNYLKKYSLTQTRFDTLLDTGSFNCVSSAVFYAILGAAVNLNVEGVLASSDHAFATVQAGTRTIDVETTNPYGFDPGTQKEFVDGDVTGFNYVPPGNYNLRAPLSQLELVSLILANRISALEKSKRWDDAIPLILDMGILLSKRTNKTTSPFFIKPEENLNAVINNKIGKLIAAKHYDEASKALDEYGQYLFSEKYKELKALILDNELIDSLNKARTLGDFEKLHEKFEDPEIVALLGAANINSKRNVVLINEAILISNERGWAAGISFAEAVLEKYGANKILEKNLQVFKDNRMAEIHNKFAALYNKGEKEAALEVLREGLTELPGNKQLLKDWELAK